MPITIIEGCDFAGKTTYAKNILKKTKGIYIHFPIRDRQKDILCSNPSYFNLYHDRKIASEFSEIILNSTLDQKIIQDLILLNMEYNALTIIKFHLLGYNVVIDRFIYSNAIYRLISVEDEEEMWYNLPFSIKECRLIFTNHPTIILNTKFKTILERYYKSQKNKTSNDQEDVLEKEFEQKEKLRQAYSIFKQIRKRENFFN